MITDPSIREQAYQYFLEEAPALLETVEAEIFSLQQDQELSQRKLTVNNLMRAVHTLKGGAANVGLETIKTIAHSFEDLLKALYSPDLEIDNSLQSLLFDSYECLRLPLTAEFSQTSIDDQGILEQANSVFAQLEEILQDYLEEQDAFPTSAELGIDVVESFFEQIVPERLVELENVIDANDVDQINSVLSTQAQVFLGLSQSLNLPGLGEIANTIMQALEVNGEQTSAIAQAALENLKAAQEQVLAGDREKGGEPSSTLLQLAGVEQSANLPESEIDLTSSIWGEKENDPAAAEYPVDLASNIWGEEESNPADLASSIWGEEAPADNQQDSRETEVVSIVQSETNNSELSLRDETSTALASTTSAQTKANITKNSSQTSSKLAQKSQSNSKKAKNGQIPQTVRVNLASLEQLNDLMGELLINQNQNVLKDEQLYQEVENLLARLKQNESVLNQINEFLSEVSPHTEPNLKNLVSEIENNSLALTNISKQKNKAEVGSLLKSAIENTSSSINIAENIKGLNQGASLNLKKQQRMLLNMRDELIDTRMSPISKVFNRFPVLIERLNNGGYEKKVELHLIGSHILVDKTIEDKLYDPLLHLVRNSFDHGLETTEQRLKMGKPEIGNIELRAYYQGSQTVIEVQDDGRGIDIEKVKQKAIKQNLISPQQAKSLSVAKTLELLFEPGFSTADKVSQLSGRGVGLDVVRSQIESLNGSINIESVPQVGTIFSLQIPLTLSIAKLMLCETAGVTYALLIDAIERIVQPTDEQLQIFDECKVLSWQTETAKHLIPIKQLSELVHYTRTPQNQAEFNENQQLGNKPILLVRRQKELLGLEVDKVLGEQELVIRPLGSTITPPNYIYGCSILKDSRLTLVVDAAALIKETLEDQNYLTQTNDYPPYAEVELLPPEEEVDESAQLLSQTLLIIDDSSSLRKTISLSLQKISNQVLQAENGFKGLEKLHQAESIKAIVCDLEMPQMNGFQFLQAIKNHPQFSQIPVVMLTTRDSDKHRKQAMDLGASAYLTKPYQEGELLSTITGLIKD